MSLRLQINLILTALIGFFVGVLVWQQIDSTRRSVREEVEAASRVATQLLTRVSWVYGQSGLLGMTEFLERLGRVRANEIELLDQRGDVLYRSPPSPYKAGRDAPAWFANIVSPPVHPQLIGLPNGRLVVRADPSRATLDGWDDLGRLLAVAALVFVFGNLLAYWLAGRALRPLRRVVDGLREMERGAHHTRLPDLPGKEAQLMSHAFNAMAQAVEDTIAAKKAAAEATERLAENRELTQIIQARIEEERGAIARELHDELGQSVTAIKSVGLSIAQRASGKDPDIERAARLVVDTAGQIYDVVHHMIPKLRPLALDRFGLADALDDLLGDWRLQHPQIEFSLRHDHLPEVLGEKLMTAVYRIIQESVNNALRHAQATRIAIELGVADGDLTISVQDNGRGLPVDWRTPGHYGVIGMRERAFTLGGMLELQKPEGGGLCVFARIPLN